MVYNSYLKVCDKKGGAGIDKETIEMFNANLSGNLYKVWNRMASGSYFPPAVRTVLIPKKQGGTRPLGIPTVGDRIAQGVVKDFLEQGQAMMEAAGVKNITTNDSKQAPGLDIHEMGGVRMGSNPKTSMLNEWNQLHHCKNVFVTDGACMTSTGSQSPSILYMAFTARAVKHAVEELKRGNI